MVDRRINAFLVVIAATVVIQLLDYQHVSMLQTSLFFNENTLKQAYAYSAETSLTNSTKTNTTVSETNLLAPQTMGTVGLTLSKEYPAIFFPMEQEYVRYDLRIINLGTTELQNQVLWTRFTSDSARTLHESKYALPDLHPGDSALLHIGPLKMHDTSDHMLFVGINRNGDSGLPNEVSMLGVSPGMPIDSFQVFGQETLERIVIGSVISVSGLGIIITYLVFWRSKKNIIKR
jgi:hypothetical protein